MENNIFGFIDRNTAIPEKELGKVRLPLKPVIALAYLYMLIPIILFCIFWIKVYFAIPVCVGTLVGLYILIKKEYSEKDYIVISIKTTIIIFSLLAVFLWLTGNGGFFFQYSDNHFRNAFFFDLIDYDWPVIYPQTGNGLCYYLLHWIVPALIGKMFQNTLMARICLFIWTLIGLFLVFLLLVRVVRAYSTRKEWLVFWIFVIWSGINIIGGIISNVFGLIDFDLNTYGWWTNFTLFDQNYSYMFRSNCDQLASVYNQTIAPWIAVAIFADKPKISTFAFLGICVFAYSPVPFLGFFAIAVFYFIKCLLSAESKSLVFRKALSWHNIIAVVTVAPVFLSYYSCNTAAVSGADGGMFSLYVPPEKFNVYSLLILVLFYILQFGIFELFIYKDYKQDSLFKFITIWMCIAPLIKFGDWANFCWNASVPAYFMLMIYTLNFVFKNVNLKRESGMIEIKKEIVGLVACFSFAALNPITQIAFGFKIAVQEGTLDLMCRGVVDTLGNKNIGDLPELKLYLVPNTEDKFFYEYVAK